MNKIKFYLGDSLETLRKLDTESINMCITSPPYWNLRDYGVKGQLGLESTFQEYITKLCNIFDEVRRVLRKDATCWINLGDTYGGMKKSNTENIKNPNVVTNTFVKQGGTSKSLCQIPSRFAIEMSDRGWILRNEIIWYKPNAMPSSAKDRFTVDFEKLFFFVKNKKYCFETQLEPFCENSDMEYRKTLRCGRKYGVKRPYKDNQPLSYCNPVKKSKGRNKRTVWKINTKPFKGAHFAVFPEKLIEVPIKAGCPENGIVLDPFMGSGTVGVVCKKLNRKFIGIELNEEYAKIAIERINKVKNEYL